MAMSITPSNQSSGKKNLDAELNLVPFIDLLICCICFLLLTSVWVQISHIQANLRGGADGKQPTRMSQHLTILVGEDGYTLNFGAQSMRIPKQGGIYKEHQLQQRLRALHTEMTPNLSGLTIASEDGIPYKHLVRTMDLALAQGFSGITVSDSAGFL